MLMVKGASSVETRKHYETGINNVILNVVVVLQDLDQGDQDYAGRRIIGG